ncbi:hypothetical protein, partial [Dapis sp. BLCC M172]|uniref:hypothetical protein n=1 Tax=Dapis sp. BLCC M172 TaxID=2975281 RepID=UPI003CF3FA8D
MMNKTFATVLRSARKVIFDSSFLSVTGVAIASTVLLPTSAEAFTFNFGADSTSSNSPATGASASVDFGFIQQGSDVKIELGITNTTGSSIFGDGATASKLTGIGFDLLDGLSFAGSFNSDGFLDTFIENAAFNPFDTLDVGIADNNNFLGGNANGALAQSQSTNVSFLVSGANLVAATLENDFFTAFTNQTLDIGARFQQVNAGAGSDKLLGGTTGGGTTGGGTTGGGTTGGGTTGGGTTGGGTTGGGTTGGGTTGGGTTGGGTTGG